MNSIYPYKVGWCPLCDQGWLEIVEDEQTKALLIECDECESKWTSPSDMTIENLFHDFDQSTRRPSLADIESFGWTHYILTD